MKEIFKECKAQQMVFQRDFENGYINWREKKPPALQLKPIACITQRYEHTSNPFLTKILTCTYFCNPNGQKITMVSLKMD